MCISDDKGTLLRVKVPKECSLTVFIEEIIEAGGMIICPNELCVPMSSLPKRKQPLCEVNNELRVGLHHAEKTDQVLFVFRERDVVQCSNLGRIWTDALTVNDKSPKVNLISSQYTFFCI